MRILNLFASTCLMALMAACTSGPRIRSDYDHSANFAAYRTFGFSSPLGTDVDGYSTLTTQRLKAATQRELEARGYRFVAQSPDLLVNFSGRLSDKVRVDQTPVPTWGYYGYRRSAFYAPWPTYAYETNVDQYTQGTLNVDIIDAAHKQMVWEGVAVGRVTDQQLDNPGPAIDAAVTDIFKAYPFRAAAK
ncbi:MAG: DUF4136 domain-containing protein [Dokdonella sp.]